MERSESVDRIEVRSGPEVPEEQAFARWEAQVSEAYVPLADRLGARADDCLITSIPLAGSARLYQDGRVAEAVPGTLVFYDSSRPYHWEIGSEWEQVVLQVPMSRLRERYGVGRLDVPTATTFSGDSAPGIVAQFFRGIAGLQRTDPSGAALLAEPGMDLLASAVIAASGGLPRDQSADALNRQRVLAFMRSNCSDPELGVDRIAQGCRMSRRTLYRVFGELEGGPGTVLRRMRIERACDLLRNAPQLPLSVVAKASGFLTERSFYRAFRLEMGTTPGAFRALA